MKFDNDEIYSRRKFFKKAAGLTVPIIVATIVPQIFVSCEVDEPYDPFIPGNCKDCSSSCFSGCSSNCSSTCEGTSYSS